MDISEMPKYFQRAISQYKKGAVSNLKSGLKVIDAYDVENRVLDSLDYEEAKKLEVIALLGARIASLLNDFKKADAYYGLAKDVSTYESSIIKEHAPTFVIRDITSPETA